MNTRRVILVLVLLGLGVATACGAQDPARDSLGPAAAIVPTATATKTGAVPSVTAGTPTHTPTAAPNDPTPVIAEDAACDLRVSGSFVMIHSISELAWMSHQVVAGTVTEVLPSRKVTVKGSVAPFTIVTDAIVTIDQQFRGQPADTVVVRSLGGSIGDCAQEFPDTPMLRQGDTLLLFLREPEWGADGDYEVVGGFQGYWEIIADGLATTSAAHLLPSGRPMPVAELEAAISAALAAGPPSDDPLLREFLVPPSEAPVTTSGAGTPTSTP